FEPISVQYSSAASQRVSVPCKYSTLLHRCLANASESHGAWIAERRRQFSNPQTNRKGQDMKVKELMSTDVKTSREDTDLSTVTRLMWDGDWGIIPIVNDDRQVVGVVTDRDICIAAATRSTAPAGLRVRDVMSRTVTTCADTDDVRVALAAMKD